MISNKCLESNQTTYYKKVNRIKTLEFRDNQRNHNKNYQTNKLKLYTQYLAFKRRKYRRRNR